MVNGFNSIALNAFDFRLHTSFTKRRVDMSTGESTSNLVTLTFRLIPSIYETILIRVSKSANLQITNAKDQMVRCDTMFNPLEVSRLKMRDETCFMKQILNGSL